MLTLFDPTPHWRWSPVYAKHEADVVTLLLEELTVSESRTALEILPGAVLTGLQPLVTLSGARRLIVQFTDVKLFLVVGEFAINNAGANDRDRGIVARHHSSSLLEWVAASTNLLTTVPGDLAHYSVQTCNDCYHVMTRTEPTVYEPKA